MDLGRRHMLWADLGAATVSVEVERGSGGSSWQGGDVSDLGAAVGGARQ